MNNLSANSSSPNPFELCPTQICTLEVVTSTCVGQPYTTIKWYRTTPNQSSPTLLQSGTSTQLIVDNAAPQSLLINSGNVTPYDADNIYTYYYQFWDANGDVVAASDAYDINAIILHQEKLTITN